MDTRAPDTPAKTEAERYHGARIQVSRDTDRRAKAQGMRMCVREECE